MITTINKSIPKNTRSKTARAGKFENLQPLFGKDRVEFRRSSKVSLQAGRFAGNRILAAVGDFDIGRVLLRAELVSLAAGQTLYGADENNDFVYFPETAVVSHLYNLADGSALEIAMVGSEGASGLCAVFGLMRSPHQAVVTIEGKAWRVKAEILRQEFSRGGNLQARLFDYANTHLAEISQKVVCASFHIIEKRLCRWLLMIHDRVKTNQLEVTHEQMSQFLGVNRPSLSMVAKALRDQGLINYARGKVFILNRRGLEAAACECYSAVQTNF